MISDELRKAIQAGVAVLRGTVEQAKNEDRPVFEVTTVSNGFIVTFPDIEEFEVKRPVLRPPAPGRMSPPNLEDEVIRRWKLIWREVYCADAEAIKVQVDEALRLVEKVKHLKAQDVLSGQGDDGYLGTAVGG